MGNITLDMTRDHFSELNKNNKNTTEISINFHDTCLNTTINVAFTYEEISKHIKALKNNKAPGIENILNEFIKHTIDLMIPLYVKLFNKILDTGDIPEDWLTGLIIPIYKNKGEKNDPSNYIGKTLLSCL